MFFSLSLVTLQSVAMFFSTRLTRLRWTVPPHSGQERAASFSAALRSGAVRTGPRCQARMATTTANTAQVPARESSWRTVWFEVIGRFLLQAKGVAIAPGVLLLRALTRPGSPGLLLVRRDLEVVVMNLRPRVLRVDRPVREAVQHRRPVLVRHRVLDLQRPRLRLFLVARPAFALDDALAVHDRRHELHSIPDAGLPRVIELLGDAILRVPRPQPQLVVVAREQQRIAACADPDVRHVLVADLRAVDVALDRVITRLRIADVGIRTG